MLRVCYTNTGVVFLYTKTHIQMINIVVLGIEYFSANYANKILFDLYTTTQKNWPIFILFKYGKHVL